MKVEFRDSFLNKLDSQVEYIATDEPQAARKFKKDILKLAKELGKNPYLNRKSIYFNDSTVRDMVFKGYTIVYLVDETKELISVFGFIKYEVGL